MYRLKQKKLLLVLFFKSLCMIADNKKIGKTISGIIVVVYSILLIGNLIFVNVEAYDFQK